MCYLTWQTVFFFIPPPLCALRCRVGAWPCMVLYLMECVRVCVRWRVRVYGEVWTVQNTGEDSPAHDRACDWPQITLQKACCRAARREAARALISFWESIICHIIIRAVKKSQIWFAPAECMRAPQCSWITAGKWPKILQVTHVLWFHGQHQFLWVLNILKIFALCLLCMSY